MSAPDTALETEKIPMVIKIDNSFSPEPLTEFEGDVASTGAEQEELTYDKQEISVVAESLSVYADELAHLIQSKTGTADTLSLIRFGAQQQLNRVDFRLPSIGLESADLDIFQQHQIVLEGIKEFLSKLRDYSNKIRKHWKDILQDTFTTTQGMIGKYESVLATSKQTFDSAKDSFKGHEHTASLTELWYHFSTGKGEVKNIIEAIKKDLELSKYVLTIYPAKIMQVQDRFSNAFAGAQGVEPTTVAAIAKKLEAVPVPADLFDNRFLEEGKPYLSVTGLETKTGSVRNPLSIGETGKAFDRLARLASTKYVIEAGSLKHSGKKVLRQLGGEFAGVSMGADVKLSTNEIGMVLKFGQQYINNVKQYLGLISNFKPYEGHFYTWLDSIMSSGNYEKLSNEVQDLIDQFEMVDFNIWRCFTSPARSEIARSLKGAKYCAYLAQRMTKHAGSTPTPTPAVEPTETPTE